MLPMSQLTRATLEAMTNARENDGELEEDYVDGVWKACQTFPWLSASVYMPTYRRNKMARAWFARWMQLTNLSEYVSVEVCSYCMSLDFTDDGTDVDDDYHCESCFNDHFAICDSCEDIYNRDYGMWHDERDWCEQCFNSTFTSCDDCDEYVPYDHVCPNNPNCQCDAPHLHFTFPNGDGVVNNDERVVVESAAGAIDDAGMKAIRDAIADSWPNVDANGYSVVQYERYAHATRVISEVGPIWQAKRGNFTRRLSSAWYKATGSKLPDTIMSQVGNLARAHSSSEVAYRVEITRELNQSAHAFYHGDSCWWTCEAQSRCALKSWGGMAIRSYADPAVVAHVPPSTDCTGRAWVQPLNSDLEPTHDVMGAVAYLVYNGYGELGGYVPARIIAQMTGMTYRRVSLNIGSQWCNGGDNSFGVLVADAEVCDNTASVGFGYGIHDHIDAEEVPA